MLATTLILNNQSWDDLSPSSQNFFRNSRNEYDKQIILTSLKHQIRFEGNLIKTVIKSQKKYYECLIEYAIEEMMLYPYHLQDKISPGLSIRPFDFYKIIVKNLLTEEKPYDSMPNFTAVDCKNILGIGRNEYIDLMNTIKSKPFVKQNMTIDSLLPSVPKMISFEPWYLVRNDVVTSEDISHLSSNEKEILDKIIDKTQLDKPVPISEIDYEILEKLYSKMMIYFDIPINDNDHFYIVTLNDFIMNRVSGDHCESLLYKIFLSLDRDYSMKELAEDLSISISSVKQAVAIFSRLGYAKKIGLSTSNSDKKKIAFLYDSTMTAFLMMGNVSQSLKKHAITMFEVGRLTFESLDSLMNELESLDNIEEDGEARSYALHAINLGKSIRLIRNYCDTSENLKAMDLIKIESLNSLDDKARMNILKKHYDVILSMSPITFEDITKFDVNWPSHYGPTSSDFCSPWFNMFILNHTNEYFAKNFAVFKEGTKKWCLTLPMMILARGQILEDLPSSFYPYNRCHITSWGHDPFVMSTNLFVYLANELVQNNPIFIQALDKNEPDIPQTYLFISLPLKLGTMKSLKSKFKSPKSIGKKDKMAYFKMILLALNDLIPLESTCGYISLIEQKNSDQYCIAKELASKEKSSMKSEENKFDSYVNSFRKFDHENNVTIEYEEIDDFLGGILTKTNLNYNYEYQLSTVHVGLAMFDSCLNQAILKGIINNNLLTSDKIETNKQVQLGLDQKFKKFIQNCGGFSPRLLSSNRNSSLTNKNTEWSLPSKSFLISKKRNGKSL